MANFGEGAGKLLREKIFRGGRVATIFWGLAKDFGGRGKTLWGRGRGKIFFGEQQR